MSSRLINTNWLYLIILLLVAAGGFLIPAGNHLSKIQIAQHQSDVQLREIARLVLAYENENGGNTPKIISDIVPDDRTDLLCLFYAPNASTSQKPADRLTNRALLAQYSDFCLPLNVNTNILAFEKPGLWLDGSIAICFRDLSIVRTNASQLEGKGKGSDNNIAPKGRK